MRDGTSLGLTVGALAAANVLAHRISPRASTAIAAGQVAGLATISRAVGLTADELGLNRRRWGSGARWGAGSVAVVAAGYGVTLAVPAARRAIAGTGASWPRAALGAVVDIPLTTVLPEEFAFRGVLTGLLARRFGPRGALAATSIVFGLWHVLPGLSGGGAANESVDRVVGAGRRGVALRVAGNVLVTTAGGWLMGQVRLRSGSLLAPVLLHWAVNGIGELVGAGR